MSARKQNAYLTVYLALTLAVLLSLCLALIEGVRSNAVYMEAECAADIALNSILAEYHQELLKQYNLFAIDSSYGTAIPGAANTGRRFSDYLSRNLSDEDVFLDWLAYRDFLDLSLQEAEITKVSILTDGGGAVFRRRAAEAVRDDMGLNLYQELAGWMNTVKVNELAERDIAAEKQALDKELETYDGKEVEISEEVWSVVKTENPTGTLEKKRQEGILRYVTEAPEELSCAAVSMEHLIHARADAGVINRGNQKLPVLTETEQMLERFFFQEYLLRYMGNYRKQSEEDALKYQIEYLIAGRDNDLENLKSVVNRLCALREASNAVYLFSDQEKKGIAKLAGYALASLMMIPEAAEVMESILIFGWAYAESIHDMEQLLAGGRVPLIKDPQSWYYGLEEALDFKGGKGNAEGTGLSYEDYLRVLMMLEKEDTLTMRAMDMVEADIRLTPGNGNFRLDGCFDSVEIRAGIESGYGYRCEITREKGYSTQ